MRLTITVILLMISGLYTAFAQDANALPKSEKPTLTVGGVVKAEGIFDTSKFVESR